MTGCFVGLVIGIIIGMSLRGAVTWIVLHIIYKI